MPVGGEQKILNGVRMPIGRSTFTKRQKEQTRQQRQRDKAERRNQRKQERAVVGSPDEIAKLREHAAAQAALFNLGAEDADTSERPASADRLGGRVRLQVCRILMPWKSPE
jgi:alkanesulfonate monooxygenase SsuD/methylene tetrahydromethanopterin reductase-like flavin-dependent oxidoreductase (luciferase family)